MGGSAPSHCLVFEVTLFSSFLTLSISVTRLGNFLKVFRANFINKVAKIFRHFLGNHKTCHSLNKAAAVPTFWPTL